MLMLMSMLTSMLTTLAMAMAMLDVTFTRCFQKRNQVYFFHLKVIKIFTVPKVKRLKASLVVLRNNVLDGLRWGVEWCLNTGHLESGLLMNIMI